MERTDRSAHSQGEECQGRREDPLYKTVDVLEHKPDKAKTKLQELKTSVNEAWEAVKAGAEKTWAEVKSAYHDAASKFD